LLNLISFVLFLCLFLHSLSKRGENELDRGVGESGKIRIFSTLKAQLLYQITDICVKIFLLIAYCGKNYNKKIYFFPTPGSKD
jgi:hypothetical protein